MWPGLENGEDQMFSRKSNERASGLGDSKSLVLREAEMICLRRQRVHLFRGRIFLCFDVTAHGVLHRASSEGDIMQQESMRA